MKFRNLLLSFILVFRNCVWFYDKNWFQPTLKPPVHAHSSPVNKLIAPFPLRPATRILGVGQRVQLVRAEEPRRSRRLLQDEPKGSVAQAPGQEAHRHSGAAAKGAVVRHVRQPARNTHHVPKVEGRRLEEIEHAGEGCVWHWSASVGQMLDKFPRFRQNVRGCSRGGVKPGCFIAA